VIETPIGSARACPATPRVMPVLLVLAALASAPPASAQVKATAQLGVLPQSTSTSPTLPVQLQINLKLSALHPAVTQGGLQCGAVAQTRSWVDTHRALLTDYDAVSRWVLATAHYAGQQAALSFPITNRSYAGTQIFSTTLTPQAQTDPATRARFAPDPTVLVACWLTLDGRPVTWDQGGGLQVVSATNFSSVASSPLVAATADAGANASINLSAPLVVHGAFFSPVAANVTVDVTSPALTGHGATARPRGASPAAATPVLNAPARSALINSTQPPATSGTPPAGLGQGQTNAQQNIESSVDSLNETDETKSLRAQMAADRQAQFLQILSDTLKQIEDTDAGIARHLSRKQTASTEAGTDRNPVGSTAAAFDSAAASALESELQQALLRVGVDPQSAGQLGQALLQDGAAGMSLARSIVATVAQSPAGSPGQNRGSANATDTIDDILGSLSQPQYASLPYVQTLRSKLITIRAAKATR